MSADPFKVEDAALFAFQAIVLSGEEWEAQQAFRDRLRPAEEIDAALAAGVASGIFGDPGRPTAYLHEEPVSVELDGTSFAAQRVLVVFSEPQTGRRFVLGGLDLRLSEIELDLALAVVQSVLCPPERRQDNAAKLTARIGSQEVKTLRQIVDSATAGLCEGTARSVARARILELRQADGYERAAELLADRPQACYGLTMCDEGWRFVPDERVQTMLDAWSTRDYLTVVSQPTSTLVLNLDPRRNQDRTGSPKIVEEVAGIELAHMRMGGLIAGLEHGILFAVASTLRREVIALELQNDLIELHDKGNFRRVLTVEGLRVKSRRELVSSLISLTERGVSELEALQTHVDRGVGLPLLLERVGRVADLVDEEIRAEQTLIISVFVVLLTIATVVIPFVAH